MTVFNLLGQIVSWEEPGWDCSKCRLVDVLMSYIARAAASKGYRIFHPSCPTAAALLLHVLLPLPSA